jgi:hypothetical protein
VEALEPGASERAELECLLRALDALGDDLDHGAPQERDRERRRERVRQQRAQRAGDGRRRGEVNADACTRGWGWG